MAVCVEMSIIIIKEDSKVPYMYINTLMLIKAMFGTAYYHTIPTRMKKGYFLNALNIWIIQGSQVTRIGRETHAIQPVHTPHRVFLTLKRQCQPFCPASFVWIFVYIQFVLVDYG